MYRLVSMVGLSTIFEDDAGEVIKKNKPSLHFTIDHT